MINNKRILAIIPARGGSKGLPNKNIKLLLDKPLIAWTIEQAKNSKFIDEIHVSTDSPNIAKISEEYGIKVPSLRPENLAQDNSSSADVVDYIIKKYEEQNQFFDYIILLEPTSPLRKKNDIDNAIEKINVNPKAHGIVSVGKVNLEHPSIVKKINENNFLDPYIKSSKKISQRQQLDSAYFPYGVLYLIKTKYFKKYHSFYTKKIIPFLIDRWQNYEIDDIFDFICTENIVKFNLDKL